MAIFKCKMCGGALEINTNETVATCEYCGTQQTLPKLDDDRKANLYDRANHFRRNNEFDKAMGIYEQILNEDNSDAESYWSLVLCRYGIEYVEDPASHKRVPTVNRAQFTSVFDDEDYKSALKYADSFQKEVYEAEAKLINEIQKGILAISQQEEPFDVFICYKETDNNGRRTQDSVIATELYHELTREGYKVFFSRITLEDKLGTAYEPYIFAALNSSKVMVVLGTKPEYFNAVWVKNEWSRYLSLIKNGEKKILIPAYRDMDPYDLPEEFSHLQAQDMTKLGFMQDLIRGINKLAKTEAPQTTVVKETVVTSGNVNAEALLKRVFIFLDDKDWKSADEYCEKVLDIDPENARAYLGKLMAELRVSKKENLKNCPTPFDKSSNHQKTLRFGDAELKSELAGYIAYINNRNENARQTAIYNDAKNAMNSAKTTSEYKKTAHKFESIRDFKDSAVLAEECLKKADEVAKLAEYNEKLKKYNEACSKMDIHTCSEIKNKINIVKRAKNTFETIIDFKDSKEKISECDKILENLYAEEKRIEEERLTEEKRIAEEKRIEEERLAEEKRIADEQAKAEAAARAKKNKTIAIILSAISAVAVVVILILTTVIIPGGKYDDAVSLMEAGKYEEAIVIFEELGGYKDSSKQLDECIKKNKYNEALSLLNNKEYMKALPLFSELEDYKDSKSKYANIMKQLAGSKKTIAAGFDHTAGLKSDGTVIATENSYSNHYKNAVSGWTDIVSISVGTYHTVGLKSDGTVIATQHEFNDNRCDVSGWSDIIAIDAGSQHTVGLKSDGTVVAVGNNDNGRCDVSAWTDIVAISAGGNHTVGLKSDGTVVAVGNNDNGQCDVSEWNGIVDISAGSAFTLGLRANGTVVATGNNDYGQCDVSEWTDIIAIAAGSTHSVGLQSNNTIVCIGANGDYQCHTSDWSDIIAITTGYRHTVGLKSDGTVVSTKRVKSDTIYTGYAEVSDWDLF